MKCLDSAVLGRSRGILADYAALFAAASAGLWRA